MPGWPWPAWLVRSLPQVFVPLLPQVSVLRQEQLPALAPLAPAAQLVLRLQPARQMRRERP